MSDPKTVQQFKDRNARLGLSPRQQRLNKLWAYYRCQQYDTRAIRWDGTRSDNPIDHEAISSVGTIPPGFYDAGGSNLPLRYRRPTAPYNLAKVIVDRFSGLLFSQQRHPHFKLEGDPENEQFVEKLAEACRFWPAMIQARQFGGSTGTVAMGFSFIDGRPVIEVHDPRWLYPDFEDRQQLKLRKIEKRFQYPVEQQNKETMQWEEVAFWYRRVIDRKADVVYQPVEVGNGDEPEWIEASRVDHELGFCPVVWLQNLPVQDDIDGDPDCHGVYDLIESLDALVAQAHKALLANCDPTVVIVSEAQNLNEIRIGSDNAIKLPDGSASFMEHKGSGPEAALSLADKLRELVLEVAQCVLEGSNEKGVVTATEVNRKYSSMLSKADVLREQYGEKGCKNLMLMILKAAAMLAGRVQATEEGPAKRSGGLRIPGLSDNPDALVTIPDALTGPIDLQLNWPPYFEPSLDDVSKASTAATQAFAAKVVDRQHASSFLAPYFGVEDVKQMVEELDAKDEEEKQQMMDAMGAGGGFGGGGGGAPPDEGGPPA